MYTVHYIQANMISLSYNLAFKLLFAARLISAATSSISDCDEVFNFWEPAHFLLYGHGMQTWEYAPSFSLRSWAYVSLHAFILKIAHIAFSSKAQSNYINWLVNFKHSCSPFLSYAVPWHLSRLFQKLISTLNCQSTLIGKLASFIFSFRYSQRVCLYLQRVFHLFHTGYR